MSAKSFIPDKDSPEGQVLASRYLISTRADRDAMAAEFGYANRTSFQTIMNKRYGLFVPNHDGEAQVLDMPASEPVINLTIPKLRDYKPRKHKKGDEETMVLHTSDWHRGKITETYNDQVGKDRIGNMFDSAMTILNLHRNLYPINNLVIVDTGDRGQGENPHQGSKLGEVSMGARDQQRRLILPEYVELICAFKQHFATVEVHFLPGNHGHEKLAPETSSHDIYGADLIEQKLDGEKGIRIHSHDNWYAMFDIQGFRCFATHFDGIPCAQGIPYFGIDRKLKAWYIDFGGFNFVFGGHFHKFTHAEVTRRFQYFMSASLVSDDAWALKKLGVSASPGATLLGIHPSHGVTWNYQLDVLQK